MKMFKINRKDIFSILRKINWGTVVASLIALFSCALTLYFQYFHERQEVSIMKTNVSYKKVNVLQQDGFMIYVTFLVVNEGNKNFTITDYLLTLSEYSNNYGSFIYNRNKRNAIPFLIAPNEQSILLDSIFISYDDIRRAHERIELNFPQNSNDSVKINHPLYLRVETTAIDYKMNLCFADFDAANVFFYKPDNEYEISGIYSTLRRILFKKRYQVPMALE